LAEEFETRVGSSVSDSRCSVSTFVSMPSRYTKYVGVLLILFGHVFDMTLHASVPFITLHGLYARCRSLFGWNVVYWAERFNCSINDLIYGRIPIIS